MSDTSSQNAAKLEPELRDMKIEEGAGVKEESEDSDAVQVKAECNPSRTLTPVQIPPRLKSRSQTQSPGKQLPSTASTAASAASSPNSDAHEEVLGGEITLKMEPGKAPKLSRKASKKVVSRAPPLYVDLPDSTEAAKATFEVLPTCTYANKSLGTTEHAFECDCSDEWDPVEGRNNACGEDSDCINRATKMECVGDCGCGRECQNQRFIRKQYADVTVIKTDKKGFGLRANTDLKPGDFVFEYIGEVIDERTFRRRMLQYDHEGIKHFYFMSLTKGEFVDATKKGNFGRFCNHSCNPNCFVDKWVVGDKLRMGIFAERKIKAGEELVFNYNVDRYGADPQPCYCGEPNCTGFIGGKTQSDNATKLSHATIEALGIDDGDGWDTAVAKKPRKKKVSEDDEEYVNELQPKSLDEHAAPKVMAALRQCTEKWIAVKLLSRIQESQDEKVGHQVIRMHGYDILRQTITTWKDDPNIVLQILDILHRLPRITRNKIQDSKIEEVVKNLKDDCDDERVVESVDELLEAWSKLEMGYRIPRMKRDANSGTPVRTVYQFERRERGRERSRSRSKSPDTSVPTGAPSAPRGFNVPKGPAGFVPAPRPPPRRPHFKPLPPGWFEAKDTAGKIYYYTEAGTTTWSKPTVPAPPAPSKAKSHAQILQDMITNITANTNSARNDATSASTTPQAKDDDLVDKKSKNEKWRDLPQDKLEKVYEGNIVKHVLAVTSRYKKDFEKDDIKRLSKEVAKKIVRGDFKSGRVKEPNAPVSSKHEKTIKSIVKEFMDKAVKKKSEREKGKTAKAESKAHGDATGTMADGRSPGTPLAGLKVEHDHEMSDADTSLSHEISPVESSSTDLKRKREEDGEPSSPKKSRTAMPLDAPPPPPPPPPPADDILTPMEEHDGMIDGALSVNGKGKVPQDKVAIACHLATPPTNGTTDQEQYTNGDSGRKHSVTVRGPA
ncbi:hypothetical protein P280DRAFT_326288 [Massarina eburnea CBS 473.64]|uniref:Histone-lysine N-methyltransferase, H3 lysine-36 specific n=1 Tax=Massarina eburnea CBS 473.64 TaxID=1395130 RepID=A0A6A6S235_9PLEO|nr:hypothetical protein P280DRAFT_326288 [Massarina eburnea CBS 473.64]